MRRTIATVGVLALSLTLVDGLDAQSGGKDLPRSMRSLAGVTLSEDSAASIRAKLGDTREQHIGAEHDHEVSWCYVPAQSSESLLELMSDASSMGTPGRELTTIRLRSHAPASDREGCARLRGDTKLSTAAGLSLGTEKKKVEKLLGKPTRSDADSLIYYYDAREYLKRGTPEYKRWDTPEYWETCFNAGPPFANVSAIVTVVLRQGRVAELRLERYDQSVC